MCCYRRWRISSLPCPDRALRSFIDPLSIPERAMPVRDGRSLRDKNELRSGFQKAWESASAHAVLKRTAIGNAYILSRITSISCIFSGKQTFAAATKTCVYQITRRIYRRKTSRRPSQFPFHSQPPLRIPAYGFCLSTTRPLLPMPLGKSSAGSQTLNST